MAVTQYIGSRYVPLFADPAEWSSAKEYEALTVVMHEGNSFTSKQYVPVGVDIDNVEYWAETGNYNAQVESYRRDFLTLRNDMQSFSENTTSDLSEWKQDTTSELSEWKQDTISDFETAIAPVTAIIPSSDFTPQNTVKKYINDTARRIQHGVMVVLGDSWSDEKSDPDYPWPSQVASALSMDGYVTAARAGNGWSHGSHNIPSQVSDSLSLVTSAGFTAEQVTLVVAFGGVNDYRHGVTYSDVANGMRTTYTNIKNTYPNARPVFIVGNTGRWGTMDELDTDDANKAESYADFPFWLSNINNNVYNTRTFAVMYSADVALWLNMYGPSAYSNIWNSDNLHPTQTGHNVIAKRVVELILGINNESYYYRTFKMNAPSNDTALTNIPLDVKYCRTGKHVHIEFQIDVESAQTVSKTVYWNISTVLPVVCGGSSALHSIPVNGYNFGGTDARAMPAYYNSSNNRLTMYPQRVDNTIYDYFGSVDFELY